MGEITIFYEILTCKYEWMSLFWRLEGTGYIVITGFEAQLTLMDLLVTYKEGIP
jgi:hypothetical protein